MSTLKQLSTPELVTLFHDLEWGWLTKNLPSVVRDQLGVEYLSVKRELDLRGFGKWTA